MIILHHNKDKATTFCPFSKKNGHLARLFPDESKRQLIFFPFSISPCISALSYLYTRMVGSFSKSLKCRYTISAVRNEFGPVCIFSIYCILIFWNFITDVIFDSFQNASANKRTRNIICKCNHQNFRMHWTYCTILYFNFP